MLSFNGCKKNFGHQDQLINSGMVETFISAALIVVLFALRHTVSVNTNAHSNQKAAMHLSLVDHVEVPILTPDPEIK